VSSPASIAETPRLRIRRLDAGDAVFICELVNDPDWIRNIGDKGVRTPDDARRYLEKGPIAMYERVGFGLFAVELKETGECAGICGLIRREGLDDVDLGFAFLPRFRGAGYAFEASSAVIDDGTQRFGLRRIVAIVSQGNEASKSLLEKLGFRFERMVALQPGGESLELYALAV
jgi:RimJ/RimL family protein N-acetyltransferase